MDFGIIGISGIDMTGALLDFDYHEVRVAQSIIAHSRQVFLATDHTKFGRNAMVNLGNISQVDVLFTDQQPPEEIQRIMQQGQVECCIC
jgi:DeoR family glycerol-3-phosphate regulon repressor